MESLINTKLKNNGVQIVSTSKQGEKQCFRIHSAALHYIVTTVRLEEQAIFL